jgi:hypothetical protein
MSTTPESSPSSSSTRRSLPWGWLASGGLALLALGVGLGFVLDRPHRGHGPGPDGPRMSRHDGPQRQGPDRADRDRDGDKAPGMFREKMRERMGEHMEARKEKREEMKRWAEPLTKIESKTQEEIAKILRPEQKEKLTRMTEARAHSPGPQMPPLMDVVLIQPRLERIGNALVLDKDQLKQVEALLKKQRQDVLAWIDSNPPPAREDAHGRMSHRDAGGHGPMASIHP